MMKEKKPIVIANWKMKLELKKAIDLAHNIKSSNFLGVEVVLCPTFVHLEPVAEILKNSQIMLGAQDLFWESEGAFTGEVSGKQIREMGCRFVIVGHSERRQYLGETDEQVHRKTKAALSWGLTPIVCVGETFDQRRNGATDYILIQQVNKAFEGINVGVDNQIIVAYEPVWVIGTGQAISPQEASTAHQVIRQALIDLFPLELVKNNFRIVYGGSVDSTNVASFTNLENTAGVLVGNASLDANGFIELIKRV